MFCEFSRIIAERARALLLAKFDANRHETLTLCSEIQVLTGRQTVYAPLKSHSHLKPSGHLSLYMSHLASAGDRTDVVGGAGQSSQHTRTSSGVSARHIQFEITMGMQ